jgi:hypothetical protein
MRGPLCARANTNNVPSDGACPPSEADRVTRPDICAATA